MRTNLGSVCNLRTLWIAVYVVLATQVFQNPLQAQITHYGSAILTTQAQVDSFARLYNGELEVLNGNLLIGRLNTVPGANISDLSPLHRLKSVGVLVIRGNEQLVTLSGLDSVQLSGYLIVEGNPLLEDISALRYCDPKQLLGIRQCPKLKRIFFSGISLNFSSIAIDGCPLVDTVRITGPNLRTHDDLTLRDVGIKHIGRGDLPISAPPVSSPSSAGFAEIYRLF